MNLSEKEGFIFYVKLLRCGLQGKLTVLSKLLKYIL